MTNIRKLPLESFPPFAHGPVELVESATLAMETYKGFLLARNWRLVQSQTIPLRGSAEQILNFIASKTHLYSCSVDYLSLRDSGLKNAFTDLSSDNSAQADTLRAAMLAELTASQGDETQAQAFLDNLLAGEGALFESRKQAKSVIDSEQDILIPVQTSLATLALRADIESSMNSAFKKTAALADAGQIDGEQGDDDSDILSAEIDQLSTLHDSSIQSLYDALVSKVEADTFYKLCQSTEQDISKRLPISAMLVGSYLYLVEQNTPATDTSNEHVLALSLLDMINRLCVVHAYLCMVKAESNGVNANRWYSFEKRRVDDRQMDSEAPSGDPVDVNTIKGGAQVEGAFIQIQGYVDNLAIEDDPSPPKFSSFFDLKPSDTDESIRVRAHMFSLINNGLSDGAFVELSGFVRNAPAWSASPGVDIDRVSLSELRKTSWYDDLVFRVRSNVLLYQDGMNMSFTPALEVN
ncbi:hypothetical protein PN836_005415 [Ningiella sp. W23]|uniref:hypothetical protein n=1 Tax=Ningiella sp. W23 TaxID=3023715 RepID=UPI003757FFF9